MAYTRYATSVATNSVNSNILSGKQIGLPTSRSIYRVGAVTPTVGVNLTIAVGDRVVINDEPLPVKASGDPIEPDDFHFQFAARPGELVIINLRNTTAGAIVPILLIKSLSV